MVDSNCGIVTHEDLLNFYTEFLFSLQRTIRGGQNQLYPTEVY
jgi:hypothetical protein